MTEETKPPILKCIAKKSVNVTIYLFVWLAIAVASLGALALGYYSGQFALTYLLPILIYGMSIVPWFAWWILAAITCIVGYSSAWCINRDLSESEPVKTEEVQS